MIAIVTAIVGGQPALISAATGAIVIVTLDLLIVIDEVICNLLKLGMLDRANYLRSFYKQISQADIT